MQSPVVREHAQIPEDQVIMKAIALGWPDDSFPGKRCGFRAQERRRGRSFPRFR